MALATGAGQRCEVGFEGVMGTAGGGEGALVAGQHCGRVVLGAGRWVGGEVGLALGAGLGQGAAGGVFPHWRLHLTSYFR